MVAIQQGGQIKDSFGGAGNAMRAMLGAITPTVAAVGLLAGAAGLATAAYYQGSKEVDGYRQAVVMTGNAAGISVNQLTDMARAMSAISGTQGAAAESLTALAGTGAIASENLQQFATVAIDLERRVGQPIKTTAQHLEELAKAPLQASLKLNEQYHYLTEAVYRQIKALQDQGKQEEAASLAQGTYAGAMAERTAELRSNLGTLERTWEGFSDAPTYADAHEIADALIADFMTPYDDGGVDAIYGIYTRMESMLTQTPRARRLLPLEIVEGVHEPGEGEILPLYEFEPDPETVLDALLPMYVRSRVWFYLLQSAASQLASQQRAMKSATEAM